jgi:hypothetical protein
MVPFLSQVSLLLIGAADSTQSEVQQNFSQQEREK